MSNAKNRLSPVEVLPPDADAPVPAAGVSRGVMAKLALAPVLVRGTWEEARRWRDMAAQAEEVKLYCQVMLGFELLALREAHGETRGRPAYGLEEKDSFAELAEEKTGIGRRTVFKIIRMAEEAVPRLKKLPGLRGFDPSAQPIGQLPAPQQEALSAAVRKLTDGLTQADFMAELGLGKSSQGRNTKGGARERQPKSRLGLEEKMDEEREAYRTARDEIRSQLFALGAGFALTEDEEIRAEINFLEARCKAMRAWIGKPHPERRLKAIEAMLPAF